MTKRGKPPSKNIVLVEFKAPKELVESFDSTSSSSYSSRSEALRALMRTFIEEASDQPRNLVKRS